MHLHEFMQRNTKGSGAHGMVEMEAIDPMSC